MITFNWGSTVTFKAVADSLTVQYTLFDPDGTPLRAQAQLSLIQVERAMDNSSEQGASQPQNPTTRAKSGSARTPSATATASPRSPTTTTATRPGGARSPRRTASTTRSP